MRIKAALVVSMLLAASVAGAQEVSDTSDAAPATSDSGRFRFGINGLGGLESVSGGGASVSGPMFGIDLRLGWQLNDLLAIYAEPHLSFGSLGNGGIVSGGTGTFIGTVMGEATFNDRFFAGAGIGYGVLNNPSGFAIQARGGFYPLMGRGDDGVRRKGLMIGVDFRSVFVDGATGILVTGAIGYEAF